MGRAELSRLVMACGGKEWEDFRWEVGDWMTYKPLMPFETAPTLEVDGVVFSQSLAISTYLSRELGLYGQTHLDGLAIDQYVHLLQDLRPLGEPAFSEKDPDKKAKLFEEFKVKHSYRFLGYFEKGLRDNGTGYLVTNKLTLADIALYDLTTGMISPLISPLDDFPLVRALVHTVGEHPGIKAWMEHRPKTEDLKHVLPPKPKG